MRSQLAARAGVTLLAATMAWVALWSWGGLVEEPGRFLMPALLGALLVAGVGVLGRSQRWPWYAVLGTQVVVLLLWVDHRYAAPEAWGGWIPTWSSVGVVAGQVHDGAVAVNRFAAPVSAEHPEIYAYLLSTSLLVLLATDFLACGLRRVPWAGLPVIVTLTVPISVLDSRLSWVVFVATSMLFMMLLATEETSRVLAWGRSVAGRDERIDSLDQVVNGSTVRGTAARIGALVAAGALVLPVLVPVGHGILKGGNGPGQGNGRDGSVTLRNPIVDLRRDLLTQQHIPLVEARTSGDPTYLRLTVLDQFNGVEWLPSARDLAQGNDANGTFPNPPGLARDVPGTEADWTLRLTDRFDTTWLPTPYPTRRMSIPRGDWRYDLRTLDVASVDRPATGGLAYQARGYSPRLSPASMQVALTAPRDILGPMTSVPGNRPSIITRIAEDVTAGATNDYDRMVRLQNWFRNTGGFSYSLAPSAGSGISELVRFLTTDKVGYCEQFAAAMAVLARSLGVPARVAVGFLAPHRQNDGTLLYTSDDLHAWPEIYFSGSGWVRFEPTPASRTGAPPSWTVGSGSRNPTAAPSITAAPSGVPTTPARRTPQAASSSSSSDSRATEVSVAVGLVLVLLVLALPRLARSRQRRRRLDGVPAGPDGTDAAALADGAWLELLATARDLGIALPVRRSVRDVAAVLRRRALPGSDALPRLDALVDFVERARYGRPFLASPTTRQAVIEAVEAWAGVLASSVPTSRARLARVFPRSVLDREAPAPVVDRPLEMAGGRELR
jgi:transglutaminase-like putative cysteine protease